MAIERYVDSIEAAQHLNISLRTFQKRSKEWRIPTYRFGRLVRFKLSEVQARADRRRE